jgi:hypothetical protein
MIIVEWSEVDIKNAELFLGERLFYSDIFPIFVLSLRRAE